MRAWAAALVLSSVVSWTWAQAPAPKKGAPDWAPQAAGWADLAQVQALSDDDRSAFLEMTADPSWPAAHETYLRSVQNVAPADFAALPKDRRGQVFLEWLRQRGQARQALKTMADNGVGPGDIETLKLYAQAGFLGPELTQAVLGPASPAVAQLGLEKAAAASRSAAASGGEAQSAAAGRPFGDAQEREVLDSLKLQQGLRPGFAGSDSDAARLEQDYAAARKMVLDPPGFRAERPDLFKAASADEKKAQDALKGEVGHLFDAMDALRAQGRLELVFAPGEQMGRAMADTSLETFRTKAGETDWKIRVRVNDEFRDVEPVQLASTLTHEFLHAYDYDALVRTRGLGTAQRVADLQEEEMRAFIAESKVDSAYLRVVASVGDRQPYSSGAQALRADAQRLAELEQVRDSEPQMYEAMLATLAQNAIRERGYTGARGGISTIRSMTAFYEDEALKLKAEGVAAAEGDAGLDREIAEARRKKPAAYEAYLVMQKNRPRDPAAEVRRRRKINDDILAALADEKARGLGLRAAASSLGTARVPPPGGAR